MFFLFCQSVRLLLTLRLCIFFLCIPFFTTIIFRGKFSLSFILGLLSNIARASFLFLYFLFLLKNFYDLFSKPVRISILP